MSRTQTADRSAAAVRTDTANEGGAATTPAEEGTHPLPFFASRPFRYAVIAVAAALVGLLVLNAFAPEALAQSSGGGDAIKSTLANVRDYIGSLMILLGGIGFAVSLGLKAASPVNENAQYLAHMGMKSSAIAVIGGAILGPIMSIIQGLAG